MLLECHPEYVIKKTRHGIENEMKENISFIGDIVMTSKYLKFKNNKKTFAQMMKHQKKC